MMCIFVACTSETPTGETWAALKSQCQQTDGTWHTVADCPSSCWPPSPTAENCATINEMACAAVCGDEPSCSCPSEQPFWKEGEGCVRATACPDAS